MGACHWPSGCRLSRLPGKGWSSNSPVGSGGMTPGPSRRLDPGMCGPGMAVSTVLWVPRPGEQTEPSTLSHPVGQVLCLPHPALCTPPGPGAYTLPPSSCDATVQASFSTLMRRAPPHKGSWWW